MSLDRAALRARAGELLDPEIFPDGVGPGRHPAPERTRTELRREVTAERRTPIQHLVALAAACVEIERAMPVARAGEEAEAFPTICNFVDPDLLAAAAVAALPGLADPRLDWPCGLRSARTSFDWVLSLPRAETHLHLGGAIPTAVLWTWALRDEVGIEGAVGYFGTPLWLGKLEAARALSPTPLDWEPGMARSVLEQLLPERQALVRLLRRWRRNEMGTADVERLSAYLRIRCSFHHATVLQPERDGLDGFVDIYTRRGFQSRWGPRGDGRGTTRTAEYRRMRATVESCLADLAGELRSEPPEGGRSVGVNPVDGRLCLEVRLQIEGGELLRPLTIGWLLAVRDALRTFDYPEVAVGFVHCYPKPQSPAGNRRPDALFLADTIESLKADDPIAQEFLVGIDAAGDEVDTSPRDHAANFRALKDAINRLPTNGPTHRFGLTLHVGEDFRDIVTGIRHVWEALTLLGLGPGDRLGHAIALSWNAAAFYERRGFESHVRRGDRILDLLWLGSLFPNGSDRQRAAAAAAERDLRDLLAGSGTASAIDGAAALMRDVATPYQDWEVLTALGVTEADAREFICCRVDDDAVARISAAQEHVRSLARLTGVIVETNPTSNLLVSGFARYADLPYANLDRTGLPTPHESAGIPFTINTDDPGIFSTTLRSEYVRVGQGRIEAGEPPQAVGEWLDQARRVSLRATFIRPDAPRGRALCARIDEILGLTVGA